MTFKSSIQERVSASYQEKNFKQCVSMLLNESIVEKNDFLELRAMSYFHLGELENSLNDFNELQKREPNNPYRYSSRAYVKATLNRVEEAIEDYKIAIHLDPNDAVAHNNLGLLQEKLGYLEKAKKHFQKADTIAGVSMPKVKKQSEVITQQEETSDLPNDSILRQMKMAFTDKSVRREFLGFVRNGFKLPK